MQRRVRRLEGRAGLERGGVVKLERRVLWRPGRGQRERCQRLQAEIDVVMPGLNGFQATRKINKDAELGGIPVILVTTKDQETDKVWGERQGAAGYIVKPAQEPELAAMIKRVLG